MCRRVSSTADYKVVTTSKLDREEQAEYHLVVTCRDDVIDDQVSSSLETSREIDVAVLDDNDHAPQFAQVVMLLSFNFVNVYTKLVMVY